MLPALKELIDQYPFMIFNFHSDRGGENINYQVASFLHRLLIKQTKSRSYHSNDNALVETKNGAVIRKNMGWQHINHNLVDKVNDYYRNFFNPYLNFHRPCGFPTITIDDKGRKKRMYHNYLTPYDALKRIVGGHKFLKGNISFEKLDKIAYQYSDNEFAEILREEEGKLFNLIAKTDKNGGLRKV
jgi:transposase InsO family protein